MTRVEIIANQALEEPLMKIMPYRGGKPCYTMIHQVDGSGLSGWCLGNDVWPEENIMFILYLEDDRLSQLKDDLKKIREEFPIQGVAAFELPGAIEIK